MRVNYETLKFEAMPLVPINAPLTFRSMMYHVLREIPLARVYLKDLVLFLFLHSMKEHVKHLNKLFRVIQKARLNFKITKCDSTRPIVILLGHRVDKDGVHVDKDKIKVIMEAPESKNTTQLRGFLGLTGYYCQYIKVFA